LKGRQFMNRGVILCSLGLFCLTNGVSASPQEWRQEEIVPRAPEVVSAKDRSLLMGRERARLHPGVPLDISGIEEGDNDFRARTPILKQSTGEITRVDPQENRRRRLEMYAGRKSFATPLAVMSSAPISRRAPAVTENATAEQVPTEDDESSAVAQWLFALIGAGLAGSILLWRSVKT